MTRGWPRAPGRSATGIDAFLEGSRHDSFSHGAIHSRCCMGTRLATTRQTFAVRGRGPTVITHCGPKETTHLPICSYAAEVLSKLPGPLVLTRMVQLDSVPRAETGGALTMPNLASGAIWDKNEDQSAQTEDAGLTAAGLTAAAQFV